VPAGIEQVFKSLTDSEVMALEVDTSFASRRVTRVLDALIAERGLPAAIRCDNGPEFTSRHFLAWAMERGIELIHIQPARPQNARVESFHGKFRTAAWGIKPRESLRRRRREASTQLNWGKGTQTRLLRNELVIRKQGRCSGFRSIAFVFLTTKSSG
jgi:transposase InsO family protein